jgi:hypothetical protein
MVDAFRRAVRNRGVIRVWPEEIVGDAEAAKLTTKDTARHGNCRRFRTAARADYFLVELTLPISQFISHSLRTK